MRTTIKKLKLKYPELTEWDIMVGRNKKNYFVAENSKQEVEVFSSTGKRVSEEEQQKELF